MKRDYGTVASVLQTIKSGAVLASAEALAEVCHLVPRGVHLPQQVFECC